MKPRTLVEKQEPGEASGLPKELWLHSAMGVKRCCRQGINKSIGSGSVGGSRAVFPLLLVIQCRSALFQEIIVTGL